MSIKVKMPKRKNHRKFCKCNFYIFVKLKYSNIDEKLHNAAARKKYDKNFSLRILGIKITQGARVSRKVT